MKLDEGKVDLPSKTGAICSILLVLIIGSYTLQKMDVLLNKRDVNITTALAENYFDSDYEFGAD